MGSAWVGEGLTTKYASIRDTRPHSCAVTVPRTGTVRVPVRQGIGPVNIVDEHHSVHEGPTTKGERALRTGVNTQKDHPLQVCLYQRLRCRRMFTRCESISEVGAQEILHSAADPIPTVKVPRGSPAIFPCLDESNARSCATAAVGRPEVPRWLASSCGPGWNAIAACATC